MKIPLTMREQYQGQLSASMLCCCFGENRLYDRFFFYIRRIIFLSEKQKNTAISCFFPFGVQFEGCIRIFPPPVTIFYIALSVLLIRNACFFPLLGI